MSAAAVAVHELRWVHPGGVPDAVDVWFHGPGAGRGSVTTDGTVGRHLRGLDPAVHVVAPSPHRADGGTPGCRAEVDVMAAGPVPVLFGPGTAGWAQRWQRGGLRGASLRRLVDRRRPCPPSPGSAPWSVQDWAVVETTRLRRGALGLDRFAVADANGGVEELWSVVVELPPAASAAALGLVARRLLDEFPLPARLCPWAVPSLAAWLAGVQLGPAAVAASGSR